MSDWTADDRLSEQQIRERMDAEGWTPVPVKVPVPRTRDGRRVRHVSRGWVVALDGAGREVSQRVSGETYVALGRSAVFIFVPHGPGVVYLRLTREAFSVSWAVFDTFGELVYDSRYAAHYLRQRWPSLQRGDTIYLDFDEALHDEVR